MPTLKSVISILLLGFSAIGSSLLLAQQPMAIVDGKPVAIDRAASPKKPDAGSKPPSGPDGKGSEAAADGEGKEGKDGSSEKLEPKVFRRDELKMPSADPKELEVQPDEQGLVAFSFRAQPWADLISWLSEISGKPIDWLELPGDLVNLQSPGRYTIEETRNLFNRHLLARGYTLLDVEAGYSIVKTDSLNPAVVPRVDVTELVELPSYKFVRTTLDAGWLSAEKLAEEFKPMMSPGGTLTAMATTNKIEAMDAAINLREIASILRTESGIDSRLALAPEMKLRHIPAATAKTMLEEFLGVAKKDAPTLTPEQVAQMNRNRGGGQPPPPQPKQPEVSIVANIRQNSVLVRAPADRVAVAMEFLKRIDVPSSDIVSLSDLQNRVQVFRLASLDPEKLIEIVGDMNILEPGTRVRVDKENQAVVVSGSAADRYIIATLVERLDGSGRSFEVMPLRRLDPVEVAESIQFLMGKKPSDDDKNQSRRSYYSYFSRSEPKEEKPKDEFRVAANTRLKQILLWANDQELRQVESLLVKLGELPPPGGSPQTVRIIEASATPETMAYLRRIKREFEATERGEVRLPKTDFETADGDRNADGDVDDEAAGDDAESDARPLMIPTDRDATEARRTPSAADATTLVQTDNPPIRSVDDFDREFGKSRSPSSATREIATAKTTIADIEIDFDQDGNLLLRSDDTAALDRLEAMMIRQTPPSKPYRVFEIRHATASWMKTNLEMYFEDGDDDDSSAADNFYSWYWGDSDDDDDSKPSGLGQDASLRFVDDIDTNTLVVTGATPSQLRTIGELIELWDVPEPINKRRTRFSQLVAIEHGSAKTISETVKEAYRDLLSSNDKTFTQNRGRSGSGSSDASDDKPKKSRRSGGSEFASGDEDGGADDFAFKGKLSLGIDPIGNTILVSAEGESLLSLVIDMIGQLDRAAMTADQIDVVELNGSMEASDITSALRSMSKMSASPAVATDAK